MICVIDYNMGNLQSVKNAFDKIGKRVDIVSDVLKIKTYDKVVLPGVGAFPDAISHLKENGIDEAIIEFAKSGKPMIGICLGMQLLFSKSYEFGEFSGLDLIEGEIIKFQQEKMEGLKIPHMGWNKLFVQKPSPLFKGINSEIYLYFVHSFHAKTKEEFVIGKTHYGYDFVSAVQKDNIYGFQPHPEKSHEIGLKILDNFVNI